MGKFAQSAAQHDPDRRGDGICVAGKWISEHFDEDDLEEFVRLANSHKWNLIVRLSDNNLKHGTLERHAHGTCPCFGDTAGKGCCLCENKTEQDS